MRYFVFLMGVLWVGLVGCTQPAPTPRATAVPTAVPTRLVPATATTTPSKPTPIPATLTATASPSPTPLPPTQTPSPTPVPRFTQLTTADCCTNHEWLNEREISFIDRDPATGQVGLLALEVWADVPVPRLFSAQLGILSPNGRYLAYPDRNTGQATFLDQETGTQWALSLQGSQPSFSPDSTHILWTAVDLTLPPTERIPTYWLAPLEPNGEAGQAVASVPRSSAVAWLGPQTLLIQRTITTTATTTEGGSELWFNPLSLVDGTLGEGWPSANRPRGFALNPSRTHLLYYTALNPNPADNGLWLVDLTAAEPAPRQLPFLGSYRWRDDTRLLYVPFDASADQHAIYQYDVATGETILRIDPAQRPFLIANNNWSVSPDGRALVFLASTGAALDGLWRIDLGDD